MVGVTQGGCIPSKYVVTKNMTQIINVACLWQVRLKVRRRIVAIFRSARLLCPTLPCWPVVPYYFLQYFLQSDSVTQGQLGKEYSSTWLICPTILWPVVRYYFLQYCHLDKLRHFAICFCYLRWVRKRVVLHMTPMPSPSLLTCCALLFPALLPPWDILQSVSVT